MFCRNRLPVFSKLPDVDVSIASRVGPDLICLWMHPRRPTAGTVNSSPEDTHRSESEIKGAIEDADQ